MRLLTIALVATLVIGGGVGPLGFSADGRSDPLAIEDVTDGRIVHYDFDGTWQTQIPNDAGNRYAGLVRDERNVTPKAGKDGSAIQFSGSPGSVGIEGSNSALSETSVTFGFWIRLDEPQKANLLGDYESYYFWLNERRIGFVVMNGSDKMAQPQTTIPVEEWVYVVGTYDSRHGARLFVNGERADTQIVEREPTLPQQAFELNMGGWKNGFHGSIDEFSVWNRSLSDAAVLTVYHGQKWVVNTSNWLRALLAMVVFLFVVGVTAIE